MKMISNRWKICGGGDLGCAVAIGGALLFGMGGVIITAGSGGAAIGFAIAGNWFAWGMAAYACS
jgi:hypothetical protein